MKFTYQYKTKDGQQHSGVYAAASRTAVYDELKKKGIKPFNVTLAPGFLNWVASSGKRGAAIAVLSLALVALICYIASRPAPEPTDLSKSMPRHQIYGDPVLVERFERGDFEGVLTNKADQMLAWFAQPGKLMCPKGVDPRQMAGEFAEVVDAGGAGAQADRERDARGVAWVPRERQRDAEVLLAAAP